MADGEPIRINKYLADCGVCSRRQADELVAQGRVTVDGETAVTGTKVTPAQEVQVDGKSIKDCSQCTFPHEPENYDLIMGLLSK